MIIKEILFKIQGQFKDKLHFFRIPGVFQAQGHFLGLFKVCANPVFPIFTPPNSRLVYDPTGTILAILYREMPHMVPEKYQPNPPGGSG